jgi:hypothetical protein
MSGRTIVMMVVVLALNWGGFALCLWYSVRRGARRR